MKFRPRLLYAEPLTNMDQTMRLFKSIAFIIAAVLALSSCLFDNSGADEQAMPVRALAIQDIELNLNKITFDVSIGVTSSGWQLASPRIELDNREYHIQFMIKRPTEPSLPVMSSLDSSITLDVVPGSTYTFKFLRFNDVPIDTTISIPN